ncbi:MAG: hypothetical protein C5B52_03515 [Bacteroidetes bacterium]|nr:MAG: hypothetical protein C5B52_03515 [Bacteroidota bacterium]
MSKSAKITMGILSFIPAVLIVIYFIVLFATIFDTIGHHHQYDDDFEHFSKFFWVFGIAIILSVITLALMIYFIIQVVNNKQLEGTERLMWVLLFIFVGAVSFPLYWYMKVWKIPKEPSLV